MVLGHSMGARVALEMIRAAPHRITWLGLLDTGVHPVREGEQADRQALVDLAFEHGMGALADRWLPPMVHEARRQDPLLMEPLKAMVMRATPEQHRRQIRALLTDLTLERFCRPSDVPRLWWSAARIVGVRSLSMRRLRR